MMQRFITGSILVVLAGLLIYFGGLTLGIAVMICLLCAVWEELRALKKAGHRTVEWPTYLVSVVGLPAIVFLGDKAVMPMVLAAALAIVTCVMFRSEKPQLGDMVMSMLPLFSVTLPCMGIMCVSRVEPVALQRTLMCLLLTVPIMGDTMAYFVGSKVRGPKLCPAVSPNKTISGAIAGLVGSVLAAALVGLIARALCPDVSMEILTEDAVLGGAVQLVTKVPSWWKILLIGLVGGLASQMGDLFASLVKRYAGVKDYSNLFPGHGGMLDRLDSILFMALVVYSIRLLV